MKDIFDLVGRLLLALFFITEAVEYFLHFDRMKAEMAEYYIVWMQSFWLYSAIFLLVLGSLLVGFGYRLRFGAVLLILYWIPMTLFTHPFWLLDGIAYHEELQQFMANFAITGGLFIVAVHKSRKYAIKKLLPTTKVR